MEIIATVQHWFPNGGSCLSASSLKRHLFWFRQSTMLELALIKEMESGNE